jgi:ribonuclease G
LDILIEESNGGIWAAALKDGRLEGLEIDPPNEEVRWGSVFWGRVTKVDTALDAVFVDLDGDNTGILYNKDVRTKDKDGNTIKGGDKAIGKTLKPGMMIAVQAKTAYLSRDSDEWWDGENKTPQLSMDITLQGRYLIFCPMLETNRISQRVRGKSRRTQLEKMLSSLKDMNGFILRSAAADLQTEILDREAKIMREMWDQMSAFFKDNEPALIMEGPDAVQRLLGDKAIDPIDRIEVTTMDHFEHVEDWCSVFAPDLMTKIVPVDLENATQDLALFEYRDILGQVEDLFQEYTILSSGGSMIIQHTAALTAVDVNKGSDKRSNLAVNIEAAQELARQMRLRNAGGIIVIDFLRMNDQKDQKALLAALDEVTYTDPCTVQIHGITKLGLMEISRKRRTPPLNERFDGVTL